MQFEFRRYFVLDGGIEHDQAHGMTAALECHGEPQHCALGTAAREAGKEKRVNHAPTSASSTGFHTVDQGIRHGRNSCGTKPRIGRARRNEHRASPR